MVARIFYGHLSRQIYYVHRFGMVLLASHMQITMVNGKKEADVHAHHLYIADYNYTLEGSS